MCEMRIVNEEYETISESDVDLSKGYLLIAEVIRKDAQPIDNITKFAWDDSDYEEVQMYRLNPEQIFTPQDDTDSLLIDQEYRITLLELGL